MEKSVDEILHIYRERRNERGPLINRMEEVRAAYNGDLVIPLSDHNDVDEQTFVANLVTTGIDQTGRRIASRLPDILVPPTVPGQDLAEKRARVRRDVFRGWWADNRMGIKQNRRARWFVGYSNAPVLIRPNPELSIPEWQLRHPLSSFPAPSDDMDEIHPDDCIFSSQRTLSWLKRRYPDQASKIHLTTQNPEHKVTLLEYVDDTEWVMAVCGDEPSAHSPTPQGLRVVELERAANRTGMCLATTPGRITLDRLQGQFDQAIGPFKMRAKLMSLEVLAAERGVFPDVWVVSNQQGVKARIINTPDWREGIPGEIENGTIVPITVNPGFTALQNVDRLERNERVTSGVPAEFGGEAASNVRTGRRGENIMSATVDFTISEAQEVFAESLRVENRIAMAVQKAYFPGSHSFFVSWSGASGNRRVDYDTEKDLDTDVHFVRYSFPGTDLNGLAIRLGQKIGTGLISQQTGREQDPEIDDPEMERDRITAEALERAQLAALEGMAQQGALPPDDLAFITKQVVLGKMELFEAIEAAQRRAQERQATPTAPSAPEAQPGIAVPGAGAEAGGAIPQPPADLANLAQSMGNLRRPQMTLASEG